MILFTVIALVVQGTLSMNDYYFNEWDTQWEKARAEDLILHDGDPVIIGCVEYHITDPEDEANRALIMRSYDISSQDTIWTFLYDVDSYVFNSWREDRAYGSNKCLGVTVHLDQDVSND